MYRLLNLKSKCSNISAQKNLKLDKRYILSYSENACLFCRLLQNYTKDSNRHYSALYKPLEQPKMRKRNVKKYTELLIVSDKSTMESRALVKKFRAKDIEKLLKLNSELNQLYSFKSAPENSFTESHTYDNLAVMGDIHKIPNLSDFNFTLFDMPLVTPIINPIATEIIDENKSFKIKNRHHQEIQIDEIMENVPVNSLQPERLEEEEIEDKEDDLVEVTKSFTKKKEKEAAKKQIDMKARQEVIHRTLAAYIEVCCQLDLHNRAYKALIFFLNSVNRSKSFGCKITDIKVYNALLRGLAKKGYSQKFLEIVTILKDENIQPNLQTYAAIFECLGRSVDSKNVLKHIKLFSEEMLSKKFTFNDVLNECSFLNDERDFVLKCMKRFDSNFEYKPKPPVLQYNNELVNGLNHEKQLEFKIPEYDESKSNFSSDKLRGLVNKQIDLEDNLYITIKSVELKEPPTEEVLKHREALDKLYKDWEDSAFKGFRRDLETFSAKRSATNNDIFFKCIPPKDFVTIIIDEAKKLSQGSETYSPTVNMLYRDLGMQVYQRYKVTFKKRAHVLDKVLKIHNEYCDYYASTHKKLDVLPTEIDYLNSRQKWQLLEQKNSNWGPTLFMDHKEWVPTALMSIGKFLYHIIMHDLTINVNAMKPGKTEKNMPAFFTIFRNQGRLVKEEVKPHPLLSKLYRAASPETLTFPIWDVPMICPPIPWTSVHNGGYLLSSTEVVRLPNYATSQKQMLKNCNQQQLYPALDSLNQLASVPWKVNVKLLDVILEVFNSGGSSKLDVPEHPSTLPPPVASPDMDKQQKYNFFKQKLQHKRKRAEMYSLWCDCLYRLSLANHFRDEIFWLPHNMDFRGRVYPIPPHLNHLGSDLARSILIFAESRPLGPEGLDWLKIHLINLTGLKKRDRIADRLQYANECMDLILDSADNPLSGKKWWAESEEPWQTLACCMEIANAARSPDPSKYESHFPVHQDGSCNGLQHYAALGRDKAGGFSVNLCPADVPQDVYSAVVALVEEQRKKDAENGVPVAKHLEGFVKRKVIKQTIMTTVYGVTRFGARLQIAKQLKDIDDFPKDLVWAASSYLTGKTFDSLRTMFTSTKEIQDWFTECARLISAVGGHHVDWVTPLGLPIAQPYFRFKKVQPNAIIEPFQMDKFEKPNVMKQKNAFPPNFIHSLDSSHMMLTSLHSEREGITFVSVHDCYWTHASTVHIMNKICREQFVALHSQPILEDLSIYLSENYSYGEGELTNDGSVVDLTKKKLNRVLGSLPNTGDLDINDVLKSVYFFS